MNLIVDDEKNIIFSLIEKELLRQEKTINLIASENYTSPEVLKVAGSILTNKYAEGYPGARYYGGCEIVDLVENEARDLGKKLFNAEYINVQPHSGSSANFSVYLSQLEAGDTVLGMHIASGGHLTHGHKVNFSGKLFNFVPYNVSPETEMLDYDEIELLANQHKPKMIVAGASAYSRIIDFERFAQIAKNNHAILLVDMAHIAGLVAAEEHPSPMPYADIVSSTTHKTLRGPRGGFICAKAELGQKLDKTVMPGSQGGPLMHIIAAKGVAFAEALSPKFKTYQKQVLFNAKSMTKTFQSLGYRIISGGTDNHLFLIDLNSKFPPTESGKKITGKIVEETLEKCSISINRNLIPFDKESPMITSGIRIGTPAITTRGFKEKEAAQVVYWIDEAIQRKEDEVFLESLKKEVQELCRRVPIYR
jgi:glycine hydroxymethyltransferase